MLYGSTVAFFFLFDQLFEHIPVIAYHQLCGSRRRFQALRKFAGQKLVNEAWAAPTFPLGHEYARSVLLLGCVVISSAGAPLNAAVGAIAFATNYWLSKWKGTHPPYLFVMYPLRICHPHSAAFRVYSKPDEDPHMRLEGEVGWYLTCFVPLLLLRCCFVYGEPALVHASHIFASANADTSRDALEAYLASVSFDLTGLLVKVIYTPALACFILCLLALVVWSCTENSKSPFCARATRTITCGKIGYGMRSALSHRPERFLPALSSTYKQYVSDELDIEFTDIEKRDGWADVNIKLPGTRIENRCFTRSVGEIEHATICGETLPPGNALATWQVSAMQGHLVSYALQEHPYFGPAAQALAAAAASDNKMISGGLRGCLQGDAWHDWPDDSERAPIPTLRSDGTFDHVALLEYQERYRRSKRQEFASSALGRLFGRKAVNAFDRQLTSCQMRTKCCLFFKPFDISLAELRAIAPRETDMIAQEGKEGVAADGASAPLSPTSPPRRAGATGILVIPRHPDDSDSDDDSSAAVPRTITFEEAKSPTGRRLLPPLSTRGSSKVAALPEQEFMV